MIKFKDIPFIAKRRDSRAVVAPTALTLVAASYNEASWVRVSFDRAISIGAINPSQITVRDGSMDGQIFVGVSATLISPVMVEIALAAVEPFSDEYVALYATATTGILAVNNGGTWAGVNELVLPFG